MKQFFSHFNIEIFTILDRDALFDGFDLLEVNTKIKEMRDRFIEVLDKYSLDNTIEQDISSGKIKELLRRYSWREKYNQLKLICNRVKNGDEITRDDINTIDFLFEPELQDKRRTALGRIGQFNEFEMLLSMLREEKIFVLSKGCVEDYYPDGVIGGDKPTKAFNACNLINTAQIVREICPKLKVGDGKESEFDCMFLSIFS